MGAIAGISTKGNNNADALMELMLDSLKHRGACNERATLKNGDCELKVGFAAHTSDRQQLIKSERTAVVLDGSLFEHPECSGADIVHQRLERTLSHLKALKDILDEVGGFACIAVHKKQIYAFRDVNGLKPLYYARAKGLVAFASERKALWRIGLQRVQRIPPGNICYLSKSSLRKIRGALFKRPIERKMSLAESSTKLQGLLTRSIQRITNNVGKIAVAFSGGLDSALTATLAKKEGASVEAVSVGLAGSPELSTVEGFARQLDLPITIETFTPDSLEEYLRRILWLIEEPNLMKVSVAVPLHWAAMVAARRGYSVMLCGQGSDELYGGYAKYARILGSAGRRALAQQLYRSVIESAQVNYERDDQACAPFGVELRTPFSDPDVIRFSLTVPSQLKVKDQSDVMRKWVLREVAKQVGLPDEMAWRRKKAIQHGTGVENAIRALAKKRAIPVDKYLAELYEAVTRLESMP